MEGQCKSVAGSERHTKSAGAEGPEPFGNGREAFHEFLARGRGGERRAIWAALSRSKMIMGPPHWGQVQGEVGGGVVRGNLPVPLAWMVEPGSN